MDRDDLITRYRQGADAVDAALQAATDDQLDQRPQDGGWTARQIVHHLADSEMTSAIRLRRLLAEAEPVIAGYDENEYARRLHYDERPIAPSLAAMRASRDASADLLDHLTDDEWNRAGTHTESGAYSVARWLEIYADHAHDHADQIGRALKTSRAAAATPEGRG
jgi:uncharacterized damage-inducible protein DinB